MTDDLKTFAKVRALHDSTTNPGEKAATVGRMKALARKAGMTVRQAKAKLDAPEPSIVASKSFDSASGFASAFSDFFNTPEFRAQHAERQRRYADRRAAALAEYGSEDAVWEANEREQALERACRPLIVRKPIINGEMDTLQGWQGGRFAGMPPDVQDAVANAYAVSAKVREAWAEFLFWEKIADDRTAFSDLYEHRVRVRARTSYLEHLLDSLPATSLNDIRARMDWMQHINERDWGRGDPEDGILIATLRADIERMGARLKGEAHQTSRSAPTVAAEDPISAVLDAANAAESAHALACESMDEADDLTVRACNTACDRAAAARRMVLEIEPTTVGGLRALACYLSRWGETSAEEGFLHIARSLQNADPCAALRPPEGDR